MSWPIKFCKFQTNSEITLILKKGRESFVFLLQKIHDWKHLHIIFCEVQLSIDMNASPGVRVTMLSTKRINVF
jgi:hypothetical protein